MARASTCHLEAPSLWAASRTALAAALTPRQVPFLQFLEHLARNFRGWSRLMTCTTIKEWEVLSVHADQSRLELQLCMREHACSGTCQVLHVYAWDAMRFLGTLGESYNTCWPRGEWGSGQDERPGVWSPGLLWVHRRAARLAHRPLPGPDQRGRPATLPCMAHAP